MPVDPPPTMPRVTVLLRTRNAGEYLPPLLDVLSRQTLVPAELLVVDSGSTDGTRAAVLAHGARVVDLDPRGFTHAVSTNLGFREARGEIVAMLSQDALPLDEGWLERLVAPVVAGAAAAYGRQVPRTGCFPLERWELERAYPERGEPGVSYSNVNSAARRSGWETIPFDEEVLIAEDRFWAARVRERGEPVAYVPEAAVLHSHAYTLREVYRRCRAEARARRQTEGRREGWGLLVAGWPRQTVADARRLAAEGVPALWFRASAYRFAQFAGLVAGGRS